MTRDDDDLGSGKPENASDKDTTEGELTLPPEVLADWGADRGQLEKELDAESAQALLTAERDEYLDTLRRLQADFDNFRKRSARQQSDMVERATEGLCMRLLPVLDALDLATEHLGAQSETNDATKALEQIDSLLRDVLAREGIERIDAVGVPFDPTVHDAVGQVPPDPTPTNTQEPSDRSDKSQDASSQTSGTARHPKAGEGDARSAGAPLKQAGSGGTDKSSKRAKAINGAQTSGPSVARVMRAGYRLKTKVLRPAMVLVKG